MCWFVMRDGTKVVYVDVHLLRFRLLLFLRILVYGVKIVKAVEVKSPRMLISVECSLLHNVAAFTCNWF